jgi:hypothetical protein
LQLTQSAKASENYSHYLNRSSERDRDGNSREERAQKPTNSRELLEEED